MPATGPAIVFALTFSLVCNSVCKLFSHVLLLAFYSSVPISTILVNREFVAEKISMFFVDVKRFKP